MQIPLQITFRHMDTSPALEAKIRERADELDRHYPNIMSCRVVVELAHHSHHQGNYYNVSINLTVPGHELAVSQNPGKHDARDDAFVAMRDAFDAAQQQLTELSRKMQREVKHHEVPPHGRINVLLPTQDYGRITTSDGRDLYFHRNSVTNADFDKLEEGMEVRFSEEMGEQGPQASSVQIVGKHHIVG